MTDKELIELAAKAAGYGDVWSLDEHPDVTYIGPRYAGGTVRYRVWNPLTDDGDALRLAVRLKLSVHLRPKRVEILSWPTPNAPYGFDENADQFSKFETVEPYGTDRYAATRRAIVRAAAEIGKAMP